MDEVRWLRSLEESRGTDLASIDVAPGVMRTVRALEAQEASDRLFPIAAAVALVAGAAAMALALPTWLATQTPLGDLTETFDLVLR
jgi:hypothetical protein